MMIMCWNPGDRTGVGNVQPLEGCEELEGGAVVLEEVEDVD